MSIVIHGNNFAELRHGEIVQNVNDSANDNPIIKFCGHYFTPHQYSLYAEQLIRDGYDIDPLINQNITPNSWINVWKHFTNNHNNVGCCTCNKEYATVGGHAVLRNQERRVRHGSNSVFIIPICEKCNGQNENLQIRGDIQAVRLFDYYNDYGEKFITHIEEHGIQITHKEILPRVLQHIQEVERNGHARYGEVLREGREGREGQHGRQGRIEQQQEPPQAGQARRPRLYYNNPNAHR